MSREEIIKYIIRECYIKGICKAQEKNKTKIKIK